LPALVICELLGVPYEDRDDFRRWSDEAAVTSDQARSTAGVEALFRYIGQLVARKMDEPAEDVLSDLIAVHRENPDAWPLDQVSGLGAGLLFAGHETTVAAIDRGVVLLLTHPAQREALRCDPDLVPAAVEEILRNIAPWPRPETDAIRSLPRWANTELVVEGVTIPAGDLVLLDAQDANHDEQIFDGPAVFDVSRADNPHMTFGHGRFFCAGASLARMELQALFGTLFDRFPTLQLAVSAEDLQVRKFRLVGGITELPVTW
jgi:pentalenolactone synthase